MSNARLRVKLGIYTNNFALKGVIFVNSDLSEKTHSNKCGTIQSTFLHKNLEVGPPSVQQQIIEYLVRFILQIPFDLRCTIKIVVTLRTGVLLLENPPVELLLLSLESYLPDKLDDFGLSMSRERNARTPSAVATSSVDVSPEMAARTTISAGA